MKKSAANRHVTVLNLVRSAVLAVVLLCTGCQLLTEFGLLPKKEEPEPKIAISNLYIAQPNLTMQVGDLQYIRVNVTPSSVQKDIKLTWNYDENILAVDTSSSFGVTITALKEGKTILRANYDGYEAVCSVTVTGYAEGYAETTEPYLYSNRNILQFNSGGTEKVSVSLYSGTAEDINDFEWTVEKPDVATIEPLGQYCLITAGKSGYTRIKITHKKATYPYYLGVYVFKDNENIPFITTDRNVCTMKIDDEEQTLSFSLVNTDANSGTGWNYEVLKEGENSPVSIIPSGNKVLVRPEQNGLCTLRVTHPAADYPLDVICRVVELVQNIYIDSDKYLVNLDGNQIEEIGFTLMSGTNPAGEDFGLYDFEVDNHNVAELVSVSGNRVFVRGKGNGTCKLIARNESAAYPKEVLLVVSGQIDDAVDASCYITTSQDYIKTKVGAGETDLYITLKGGSTGDAANFVWAVTSRADDGTADPVLELSTVNNGSAIYGGSGPRTLGPTLEQGHAVLIPKKAGTATITVTHPKILYPTEISVRILESNALLEEPIELKGEGLIQMYNGETRIYSLALMGKNVTRGDDSSLVWTCDNQSVDIATNGIMAVITAPARGSGKTQSYITVTHPKAEYAKKILLVTADSDAQEDSQPGQSGNVSQEPVETPYLTTSDNVVGLVAGGNLRNIAVTPVGIPSDQFSKTSWESSDSSVVRIHQNGTTATFEPVAEGSATVSVTHPDCYNTVTISVMVVPPSEEASAASPKFLTTSDNVVTLSAGGSLRTISVTPVGISRDRYSDITWNNSDPGTVTVFTNGTNATLQPSAAGTATITVTHPDSYNAVTISVIVTDYVPDESGNQNPSGDPGSNVLDSIKTLYSDELYHNLEVNDISFCEVKYSGYDTYDSDGNRIYHDFATAYWTSSDSSTVTVKKTSDPLQAMIQGLKPGTARITCNYEAYSVSFTVNVYEEGKLDFEPEVYFTTGQNVVSLTNLEQETVVNITPVNLNPSDYSGITWQTDDNSIIRVVPNGTSATIISKAEGETVINVTHPKSMNTVKIHVRVGSEYVIQPTKPAVYISSPDVLTFLKNGEMQKVTAVLVNSDQEVSRSFSFSIDNPSVAQIVTQSNMGNVYIKPLESGQAELTISNPESVTDKKITILVGNSAEELASICYLTTASNVVAVSEGGTKQVSVQVKNNDNIVINGYYWESEDPSIVSVTSGGSSSAVLSGNSIGTTVITASNPVSPYPLKIIVQCVDPISVSANPYIQLTSSVINLNLDSGWTTVTADLVGGKSSDYADFVWEVADSTICQVYGNNEIARIRGLKAGSTYIRVRHPKADFEGQMLVIVDEVKSAIYDISLSQTNQITLRPDSSPITINATLVNGDVLDKYNFTWSLDKYYDAVDMVATEDYCTITPSQVGQVTLSVSHPKAQYQKTVVITVQEYSDFSFPHDNYTMTAGNIDFLNMQVPYMATSTYIEYESSNSAIVVIEGTKKTAQIRGVSEGTATVTAKLKSTSTNTVQGKAEMLVYVKAAPAQTMYINLSQNIFTNKKDNTVTIKPTLSGSAVETGDEEKLVWTTTDTANIAFVGAPSGSNTFTGKSASIRLLKPGVESVVLITHPKTSQTAKVIIVAEGERDKILSLSNTSLFLFTTSNNLTITASITNAESTDYNSIRWEIDDPNVARISNASGKSVSLNPISAGTAVLAATWNNQRITCDIEVQAPKSITLSTTNVSVSPGENFFIDYTINPPSDSLDLSRSAETSAVIFTDQGHDDKGRGKIMVTGIQPGTAQIYAFTNPGGVYAKCAVTCEWDYRFKLTKESNRITKIPGPGKALRTDGTYEDAYTFSVTTKPEDAVIALSLSPYPLVASESELNGQPGVVYSVSEHADGSRHYKIWAPQNLTQDVTLYITAKNPRDNDKIFGQAQISGSFQYSKVTPVLSFANMSDTFGYSRFDAASGAVYVGDGESITLNVGLKEDFVPDNQWSLVGADLKLYGQAASSPQISLNGNTYTIANSVSKSTDAKTVTLTNPLAVSKKYWNITELKVPIINVQTSTYKYTKGSHDCRSDDPNEEYDDYYYWDKVLISSQKLADVNLLDYISWDRFLAKRQSTSPTNYDLNDFLKVGAIKNGKYGYDPSDWGEDSANNSQFPLVNYTKVESILQNMFKSGLTWSGGAQTLGPYSNRECPYKEGQTVNEMEITNSNKVQYYGFKTLKGDEIPEKYRYISKEDYKEIPWFYLYEHSYYHSQNLFNWTAWTGKAPETDTGNCTKKEAFKPEYVGRDLYGLQTGILTVIIRYKNIEQKLQFPVYTSCYENVNKKD